MNVRGILLRVIYKVSDGTLLNHNDLIKYIYEALNMDMNNYLRGTYQNLPFRLKYVQRKNNELALYISFLGDQFANMFINKITESGRMKLGNIGYAFKTCEKISSESLPVDWSKEHANRLITLEFSTPTYFQSGHISLPLPVPRLVWGSLAKIYEFYTQQKLPDGFRDDVEKYVTIQAMNIQTEKAVFSNCIKTLGFVGLVEFKIESECPVYIPQILVTLAKWAEFTGVGLQTVYGMGVARIRDTLRTG